MNCRQKARTSSAALFGRPGVISPGVVPGKTQAFFRSIGPLIAVKKTFCFTACTLSGSLLEPILVTAKESLPCGVVPVSPAYSSFDPFQRLQTSDARLCRATKSIGWGAWKLHPNINGKKRANRKKWGARKNLKIAEKT
jgi:hypothetical protein